jgi:hypothetical protein
MNRFMSAFLALATALAIAPAAIADSASFIISGASGNPGDTISGSGTITFVPDVANTALLGVGVEDITGITGTFSDTYLNIINDQISYYPASYDTVNPTSLNNVYGDNLLYLSGDAVGLFGLPAGGQLDNNGLIFTITTGNDFVCIWGMGTGSPYGFEVDDSTGNEILDESFDANFVVTPEPGSLLLLGTGLVGLAGMLRRKLRV